MAFFRLIHKVQCRCCNLFILCIHFYVVSYLCVKCTPHWIEKTGNFSMRGYLPLIWKDCSTHVHGLAIYLKEGLPLKEGRTSTGFASLTVFLLLFVFFFPPLITFFVFVHGSWFCFIYHTWGSLDQPICCFCFWRL